MGFKAYAAGFIVGVLVAVVLDFMRLYIIAREFYRKRIGHIQSGKIYWPAAAAYYCLFVAGILYLVIGSSHGKLPHEILIHGAVVGLLCFVTYGFTNWTTLKKWPARVVIADVAWGVFMTVCITGSILAILKLLNLIQLSVQ